MGDDGGLDGGYGSDGRVEGCLLVIFFKKYVIRFEYNFSGLFF